MMMRLLVGLSIVAAATGFLHPRIDGPVPENDDAYLRTLDRAPQSRGAGSRGYLTTLEAPPRGRASRWRSAVRVKSPPPKSSSTDRVDGMDLPEPSDARGNQTTLFLVHEGDNDEKPKSSREGNFRTETVDRHATTFRSVGGYRDVKKALSQIIDMLQDPERYKAFDVRVPKGILLEGPTGNGKTLLARAFSGEIRFPIIATSGAEFNEKYVGVGAARVRELFDFARDNRPCVVFIDEFDALARRRPGGGAGEDGSGDERSQTLNQLLVALDGFERDKHSGIVVMAATNRLDILDPSVIRPGRMDRIIHVPNPDAATRREIVEIHIGRKPINVSVDQIVGMTNGMSGAQIENMLNEASLRGIRTGRIPVDARVLEETRNVMILGQSTETRNLSASDLRRVATHEVGHLLVALHSEHFDRPTKVTIDSSVVSSAGYTIFERPECAGSGIVVREYLADQLRVLLGGRVAEEVVYGSSVSSGAFSDLEQAFEVATKMVTKYGMGASLIYPHFSEAYRERIDQQIHFLIMAAYRDTKKYLEENRLRLDEMTERLLQKKSLHRDDDF